MLSLDKNSQVRFDVIPWKLEVIWTYSCSTKNARQVARLKITLLKIDVNDPKNARPEKQQDPNQ